MIHIEKYHATGFDDEDDSHSIAECGIRALLKANGDVVPPDYDFYQKQAAYKADCIQCLQAFMKRMLGVE